MPEVLRRFRSALTFTALALGLNSIAFGGAVFLQTNLVSDIPGLATVTDLNLKNPWGVSFSPTSPFWVSDQVTGVATLYNAAGTPAGGPLIVTIPPASPTGQVFNSTTGFDIGATPSTFIFSTLAGTIDAWNGAQGTTAAVMHTTPGAVYTGLALFGTELYAANKATGHIDVFDSSFNPVTLGASAFVDASIPAGMTPYNIQTINGKLYVEYSANPRGTAGGSVAVFDGSGNLLQTIADSHLDSPWGITLAPGTFAQFGGDLLIGNLLDGRINAFDPVTGAFAGTLMDSSGNPIANPGLWALEFRNTSTPNANTGSDPNALFFVAGINGEADGLFGRITVVTPEPASISLFGIGLLAAFAGKFRRRA